MERIGWVVRAHEGDRFREHITYGIRLMCEKQQQHLLLPQLPTWPIQCQRSRITLTQPRYDGTAYMDLYLHLFRPSHFT